ncbi:MAG: hypothetical protein H0U49_03755, partial [Parachlamydiaceae bacterium]|nr:hypothetical protein [Parachlamydiaceae bacterium]
MDQFWEEFETGEIHFRDKWQFELKSEFFPLPNRASSEYTQEFYIFIPNSLRINSQTYSKDEFYQAQTSLIRFKTPEISFQDLLKPTNSFSPLIKLQELGVSLSTAVDSTAVEGELKLFANIFRSSLRRQVYPIMLRLENANSDETYMTCKKEIEELFAQMDAVLLKYEEVKAQFLTYPHWQNSQYIFEYVE